MAVRTYADAVRAALMRQSVKSAQLTCAELLGLPEKKDDSLTFQNLVKRPAPAPKQTGSGPALVAAPAKKDRVGHGESVKAIADALRNIKNAPARALSGVGTTIDDLKSIGRKLKDAIGFSIRDVDVPASTPATGTPEAAPASTPASTPAPTTPAAAAADGSVGASSLLTPRNMAIAGGVALAGGGAALAYKLISDRIARRREEEKRRRQQKQAFAPPPRAVPGISGNVQFIGRLPESFMDSLRRARAPRGGKAGLIASLIATLATGGALAGSLAKAPKGVPTPPPTAMDKLLAVLKSPAAKTVGLGLGAAGLGAGAVYGGMKLREKLTAGDEKKEDKSAS